MSDEFSVWSRTKTATFHTLINEADCWKWENVRVWKRETWDITEAYTNRCLVGTAAHKRISKGDFLSVWAHSVSEEDKGWKTNLAMGQD